MPSECTPEKSSCRFLTVACEGFYESAELLNSVLVINRFGTDHPEELRALQNVNQLFWAMLPKGTPMSASVTSERSVSLWMPIPAVSSDGMDDSKSADLVVIGGGMAGLSVAYEALLAGREVLVLDRGPVAAGMTARTTAHLASALDDRYYKFVSQRGENEARLNYPVHP